MIPEEDSSTTSLKGERENMRGEVLPGVVTVMTSDHRLVFNRFNLAGNPHERARVIFKQPA